MRPVIQVGPRGGRIVATRTDRKGHVRHEYERPGGDGGEREPAAAPASPARTVALREGPAVQRALPFHGPASTPPLAVSTPHDWRGALHGRPPAERHPPALRRRLAEVEDGIRHAKTEAAVCFSGNGARVFDAHGDEKKVEVGPENTAKMRAWGDVVFTHNHPTGAGFSPSDLYMAQHANVAELRACVPGGAWVVRRPKAGWPEAAKWTFAVALAAVESGTDLDGVFGGNTGDPKVVDRVRKEKGDAWITKALTECTHGRYNFALGKWDVWIEWEPAVGAAGAAEGGGAVHPRRGVAAGRPAPARPPAPRTLTLAPPARRDAPPAAAQGELFGRPSGARRPRRVALASAAQQRLL